MDGFAVWPRKKKRKMDMVRAILSERLIDLEPMALIIPKYHLMASTELGYDAPMFPEVTRPH